MWIKNNFKEDYVYSTTVRNVNSYVIENELRIDVDDVKDVPVNLAYGGNVFAIVPAARFGIKIQPSYMERIKHYSARIREVIAEKGIAVTLVQWYDEPKSKEADLRVVHSSGYGSPDRSPGGTGTSAKLACLAQDGKLQPGAIWRQASIIGSQFTASYQRAAAGIIPTIRGEAWVCGDNQLILNPDDPFCWGIAP